MIRQTLSILVLAMALPVWAESSSPKTAEKQPSTQQEQSASPSFFEPKSEKQVSDMATSVDVDMDSPTADTEIDN